jgi:hypothetical protein
VEAASAWEPEKTLMALHNYAELTVEPNNGKAVGCQEAACQGVSKEIMNAQHKHGGGANVQLIQ